MEDKIRNKIKLYAVSGHGVMLARNPLVASIIIGDQELFNYYLSRTENVDELYDGHSPLYTAISHENLYMIESLLRRGANIRIKDTQFSYTPLEQALSSGVDNVMDLVLRYYQPVKGDFIIHTLLANEVLDNLLMIKIIGKLIKVGVDINELDEYGTSILYQTSIYNSIEVMKFLLENGANTNINVAETEGGNTPLHVAAEQNSFEQVKLLLDYDADITIKNNDGYTPRDLARRNNADDELIKYLDEWGNFPDIKEPEFS
jgi:ankyrin repeat protein